MNFITLLTTSSRSLPPISDITEVYQRFDSKNTKITTTPTGVNNEPSASEGSKKD